MYRTCSATQRTNTKQQFLVPDPSTVPTVVSIIKGIVEKQHTNKRKTTVLNLYPSLVKYVLLVMATWQRSIIKMEVDPDVAERDYLCEGRMLVDKQLAFVMQKNFMGQRVAPYNSDAAIVPWAAKTRGYCFNVAMEVNAYEYLLKTKS